MSGSFVFSQKFSVTRFFSLAITQTTAMFFTRPNASRMSVGRSGMTLGT